MLQFSHIFTSKTTGVQGAGSDDGAGGGGGAHLRLSRLLRREGLRLRGRQVDIPGQRVVGHPHRHHRGTPCQVRC